MEDKRQSELERQLRAALSPDRPLPAWLDLLRDQEKKQLEAEEHKKGAMILATGNAMASTTTTRIYGYAPFLEITGPNGQYMIAPLSKVRMTIGRFPVNAIALQPDPQQFVIRQTHCLLEREGTNWHVVSEGRGATLICRGKDLNLVRGRVLLADGDQLFVPGGVSENGSPLFWELLFRDPAKGSTTLIDSAVYLEYEEMSCKLVKITGKVREQIRLSAPEDRLISYMFACNRANDDAPILLPAEDLIRAAWGLELMPSSQEERLKWLPFPERILTMLREGALARRREEFLVALRELISSLRKKIELDPQAPQFLVEVNERGYLLNTHALLQAKVSDD